MAEEKLIYPIGFDLESGIKEVEKEWKTTQKRLENTFKANTIEIDADISEKVLNKLYAKFEGLIKSIEKKVPQIQLKIPNTVDFEAEINRLKTQLRSINLGELTDGESKDLYLYIRQLEALAKALKEVNKQEQLRQANRPENVALREAQAQEKLSKAKAQQALIEQRRAKIATENARQAEINARSAARASAEQARIDEINARSAMRASVEQARINEVNARSAERNALIAEQRRAATARAETAELRLAQAQQRTTRTTERQNKAYKTQETYLKRLASRMIAYASVHQVFSFLRNIREVTAEFELQRVALGSIIGDLNEANKMFEQIKAAAVKSPFQIKELVTYTKQLAAYKIGTDELFETTQRLADISAGLGVSMDRLVLAYGQIRATGYLRASEVRQLTEAGIPIVEELAQKMSQLRGETVSAAEVMGMISERAISFGMVKEVFEDMTSAGGMFYKMQEKQAETLAGQWSNLQDSVAIMYEEIGNTESVNNAMTGMIGLLKSLAQNWQDVGAVIASLGASFSVYYIAMKNATVASKALTIAEAERQAIEATQISRAPQIISMIIGETRARKLAIVTSKALRNARIAEATATNVLSKAWAKLRIAMLSNPYTAVLVAIAGIATWLLTASDNADRLNKELDKINTEGTIQMDQQVRNFERLARAIRDNADGSSKQAEALAEIKRAYGEFLPSQDAAIINLTREKEGYDAVTRAIREKIAMQMQEQKINKIASEYGEKIADAQSKLVSFLTDRNIGSIPKEEATRIANAIQQAVSEGLLNATQLWKDQIGVLNEIIEEQVGYSPLLTLGQYSPALTIDAYQSLIKVFSEYNMKIQEVESSMESATGSFGKYTKAYDDFKKNLGDITIKGTKFSYEWDKNKIKKEIEAYHKFVKDLLSKEEIKFSIGETINFDALYKTLGNKYPALKNVITDIQKEYKKLIPTDTNRLIRMKFEEYASEVGISMDKVKEHLKSNETTTEDWAKNIDNSIKSLKSTLAEYRLDQEEGYAKHGAPFRDMTEDIQELEKEIKVLELIAMFFKDLFSTKSTTKKVNPRIAQLNEELSTVEKIYKEYQELRKVMSDTKARANIENMFKGVNFKILSRALSLTEMRKEIEKALKEARKLGDKKQILELEYRLGKFDADESQKEIEKQLKKLSDDLSRTKVAKEFFDKILGLTGDKQLSASLTMSVYGIEKPEGELSEFFAKSMAKNMQDKIQQYLEGVDISSAINKQTGEIDPIKLEKIIEGLDEDVVGPDNIKAVKQLTAEMIKGNASYIESLYSAYEKFLDYEHRKTIVAEREANERKEIEKSTILSEDEKAKLTAASNKRERAEKLRIDIEQFKAGDEYVKIFEDIENLSTASIRRLMQLLDEFMKKNAAALAESPEQLKTLMGEYQKMYEGLINRNPLKAISSGFKEYITATKEVSDAKKELKEAQDNQDAQAEATAQKNLNNALDKQRKALSKNVKGFEAASSAIQNFGSLLTDITDLLGIAEDSEVGEFVKELVKWLGIMAGVLGTIAGIIAIIEAELAPLLAIAAAIAALGAVVTFFANKGVRRANEEIERQQKLLDQLTYSYERLEKAIEKAFGSQYISNYEQRIANLEAQQRAYLKQAEAERSKGKKADKDKIKEYEEQARDTADSIADMRSELSEYFLGADLTSAARDFANAWIEAYKEFGSTTDAMKEKFQDMIQNMIVESFAAQVIQTALKPIFDSIDEMSKDGMLDMSEASKIVDMTNVAIGNIDTSMSALMQALAGAGISVRDMGTELTGISRNIATASEESILGLAAGINTQNFYISQVPPKLDVIIGLLQGGSRIVGDGVNMQDLVTIQNQHLAYLPNIAQNTADTVARCERAALACERVADNLDRVIKPRGTQSSYTLSTSL